jgi:hypothetical protein
VSIKLINYTPTNLHLHLLHLPSMRIYLPLLFLLLGLFSCGFGEPSLVASEHARQIMPWQENPAYWSWGGTTPVLLLGAGLPTNLFQSEKWENILEIMKSAGCNYHYLEVKLDKLVAMPDSTQQAYEEDLWRFMVEAGNRE